MSEAVIGLYPDSSSGSLCFQIRSKYELIFVFWLA